MLFVLQPLLQGKSNHQAVGLAFHFEKCQVWTRPNPRIICGAAGGLSGGWRSSRAPVACAGTDEGSEKHLSAMGKHVQADTAHCPRSGLPFPEDAQHGGVVPPHCPARQGYQRQAAGKSTLDTLFGKDLKNDFEPPRDYGSLAH